MKKNIKLLVTAIVFAFSLSTIVTNAVTEKDVKECVIENLGKLTKDENSKEDVEKQNNKITEEDVKKCVIENLDELKKIS